MAALAIEGLDDLLQALGELSRPTSRNVLKRVLTAAAEPVAAMAAQLAPSETGRLAFSISVSTALTRSQRGDKASEVEVYIGPAGGNGALFYASFEEFGTAHNAAHPFMRPAWDSKKAETLTIIETQLGREIEAAAARAARKLARLEA